MRLPFIDLDFTCKVTIRIGLDWTTLDLISVNYLHCLSVEINQTSFNAHRFPGWNR